ncbi:DciA family protein [Roseomonas sp. CCTCC AB2023176]|uniref:DciA family protein n=1 Tax=Roseomonas sp. CCTCC AB2023176 TaxID=3342640 RepID=UPI0035E18DDC
MGEAEKEGPGGTPASPRPKPARRVVVSAPAEDVRRPELGPRPIGSLVPRLTRPAFKRRSPAGALLLSDWAELVGPAIAAVTMPKRLSAGTLTIACAGPVAMELQHLAPQLIHRINAALGSVTVASLRFVQAPAAAPAPRRPVRQPSSPNPSGNGSRRSVTQACGMPWQDWPAASIARADRPQADRSFA